MAKNDESSSGIPVIGGAQPGFKTIDCAIVRRPSIALLLMFCVWLPPVSAQMQMIRFEHLTIDDGLSQSSVNAIEQDHRGFLWVGTQDGLNRFDGYRFEVMRNDPDDPASLSNNNVTSIYEDSDRVLWVGTTNGTLHRYRPKSRSFDRFRADAYVNLNDPESFSIELRDILETTSGEFWIGTGTHGLLSFDRESGHFEQVPGIRDEKINQLIEVSPGELWIAGARYGLTRFDVATHEVVPLLNEREVVEAAEFRAIVATREGEVWAADDGGKIWRFNIDGTLVGQIPLDSITGSQNHAVRAMIADRQGRVWVGLIGGGVRVFSAGGKQLGVYKHTLSDPYSLKTDTAYTLIQDNAGVLWVGSLAAGLSKTTLTDGGFTNFRHVPDDPMSLSHNMVNEFAEAADGRIWVGSSGGGISQLNPETGRFVNLRADPIDPTTISSDRVWGMHLDDSGVLWVGTWGYGLNRFDTATGRATRYLPETGNPHSLPGEIVTAITGDGAGGIYAGLADGGVVRLAAGREEFERLALFDREVETEFPVNVATLFTDSRGTLWVGTWNRGLCVREAGYDDFRCHTHNPSNFSSINDNNIRAITEDDVGSIWIATGNGIARYDERTKAFDRYTSADGLVPGVIYGIVPESETVLWLSSNRGLMRFDTMSGEARQFEYSDGLQANEFNGDAFLRSRSGRIYFGGVGGITSFEPDRLPSNPVPPKVVITEFSLFNIPVRFEPGETGAVLSGSITETDALVLDHDQNSIGFEFAGLHYVSPERNRYAYRLEGLDQDWNVTGADRRFATYTNLDPGSYRFHVRAANSDGTWSVEDRVIAITVRPPWWMTWWVRLAMIVVLIMALLLFIRWRLKVLRDQTRHLESEVQSRTRQILEQKQTIEEQANHLSDVLDSKNRFFAQLSHEFRTPITLMLGPIEEQLTAGSDNVVRRGMAMAKRNGRHLLHLVDQLLSLAKHGGQHKIAAAPIALAPVARVLVASFESAARRKGLTMRLTDSDDAWVESDTDALQAIIVNLLSNAVKYTDDGGNIDVSISQRGDDAILSVADTGIGIDAENIDKIFNIFERATATASGTGIGLALVKEMVEAHGGDISVTSEPGRGSRFEVRLPAVPAGSNSGDGSIDTWAGDVDLHLRPDHGIKLPAGSTSDDSIEDQTVLIIDDNDDMRSYVASVLNLSFTCLQAQDGESGLQQARELIPDLIVCDVMMPGIDGFEVLNTLRNDDRTCHIPVILLTALSDESNRLKGLERFADDYIGKPFNRSELLLKARNLLELNRLRARRAGQALYLSPTDATNVGDILNERDRKFLARLEDVVAEKYRDAEYRPEALASDLSMSQRQLQRKFKALLDTVPAAYLREFRLNKARDLLLQGNHVSDVAYSTGFSSPSYFGKCFRARFDQSPSAIRPG